MTIDRPQASEFNPFYAGYMDKVTARWSAGSPADGSDRGFRAVAPAAQTRPQLIVYAAGKWSVKELVGHMSRCRARVRYRLLHIVRGDQTPLAGMDENAWAPWPRIDQRRIAEIADEMIAVRRATVALIESLDDAALTRSGVANNYPISARALVWILPGHAQHHLDILRERYGWRV